MEKQPLPFEKRTNLAENMAAYTGLKLVVELLENSKDPSEIAYAEEAIKQLMNILKETDEYEN